jgi:phosphoribosylformylglycinamidine synthase
MPTRRAARNLSSLLPGALLRNERLRFVSRRVPVVVERTDTPFTAGYEQGGTVVLPVKHGEGRYVHPDIDGLHHAGQVALRYLANPNGSAGDVAGICDPSGVVLGLMPHPENHVVARQHPRAARGGASGLALGLFERGVRHARSC